MTTQLSRQEEVTTRPVEPAQAGPTGRRPRKSRFPSWRSLSGWVYVIPALAIYGYVVIVPTVQSVWYSFWDWNGVGAATWVWFGNYIDFLSNPRLGLALQHTLVFMFFYALLPICLGLVSAALVSRSGTRGNGFFRTVIFLPQVLTSVVIVVMWNEPVLHLRAGQLDPQGDRPRIAGDTMARKLPVGASGARSGRNVDDHGSLHAAVHLRRRQHPR